MSDVNSMKQIILDTTEPKLSRRTIGALMEGSSESIYYLARIILMTDNSHLQNQAILALDRMAPNNSAADISRDVLKKLKKFRVPQNITFDPSTRYAPWLVGEVDTIEPQWLQSGIRPSSTSVPSGSVLSLKKATSVPSGSVLSLKNVSKSADDPQAMLDVKYLEAQEPSVDQRTMGALVSDGSNQSIYYLAKIALVTPDPFLWEQALLALDQMAETTFTAGVARNRLVTKWKFQIPTDRSFDPSTPLPANLTTESVAESVPSQTTFSADAPTYRRRGSVGDYFGKVLTCLGGGTYLGAVVGVLDLVVVVVISLLITLFQSGLISAIALVLVIGVLLYLGGIILAYLAAIAGGIIGGVTGLAGGLITGLICGFIYSASEKDEIGNVQGGARYLMGIVGTIIFGGLGAFVNNLLWFQWDGFAWMGWINIIAFAVIGYLIGSMNAEDLESMTSTSDPDEDGVDLMAPFRLFGSVAGGFHSIGDKSANTVADVASNRTTIRQDGRTYHRGLDGNWRAEKNLFGQEKVEQDVWGRTKVEKDFLGRQKLERDISGRPIIPPKYK